MSSAPVEKYELILAADPRSRVFVELGRALVERGNAARAVEVCRQGLEHHPGSIQGRMIWAKALLMSGDVAGAVGQLEAAMAVEPSNPYACNLAAEMLVERGMAAQALPILEKALALQPANEQIRRWLAEAREGGAGGPASLAVAPAAPANGASLEPPANQAEAEREDTLELGLPPPESAGTPAPPPTLAPPAELSRTTPAPVSGGPARPPSLPPQTTPRPPPVRRPVTDPRFALSMIPERARPTTTPVSVRPATPSASEVARIAHDYERELRMKLVDAPGPPPGFWRRHWVGLLSTALALLVAAGGTATYLLVRRQHRAQEVRSAVESAKKGLARDTVGSLREAARVLAEARELAPDSPDAAALSAEAAGLLASDHGDTAARELARRLADSGQAGAGAWAARYLIADASRERRAAADAIAAAPTQEDALLRVLAGEVLLSRGDAVGGLKLLEAAARSSPPMLRALADLGDHHAHRGAAEQALGYYLAALAAHPTHPRSALGAAEARLALGRDLDAALRDLRAVEADAGSAPPAGDQVRFQLAMARLLAATGDRAGAAARLDRVADKLGARAEAAATTAEIDLASGALDRSVSEAEEAVRLAPQEIRYRVLLARALAGRGQYRDILGATNGLDAREIRIWRGVAHYQLGDYAKAHGELERTRRDGKMPAEAAAYYALAEFAMGQENQARALLRTLTALESPPVIAFVAAGRLDEIRGSFESAERQYRSAVAQDPTDLEGNCSLGRLLLSRDRVADALPFLEKATQVNPFHSEARIALARARLSAGNAREARTELAAVLASEPRNAEALRTSVAAAVADQDPAGARRAADRALDAEPGNPRSWLAVARAALAQGDIRTAQRFAERAVRSGKGSTVAEAQRLLAEARSTH